MSQDNNGKTYSYDVCSQCKITCCQDAKPPLSGNRKKILTEHLKEHHINVENPFTTREGYTYPSVDKGCICVFNDKQTKRCIIHSVKPETCVAGPITFDINFHTGMVEFYLKKSEICAYAGVLFNDKPSLRQHYLIARDQIVELIKQLTADELRAICKIDEPQTFKFCQEPLPPEVAKKLDL
ncbi:MAG TPA: YkgJ family cysteine cluster protein [Candidatus Acidoferrales bacterium]|nr:YkgJ family cysteine cluster protein [Candidatus Acidoferrales bacterium]